MNFTPRARIPKCQHTCDLCISGKKPNLQQMSCVSTMRWIQTNIRIVLLEVPAKCTFLFSTTSRQPGQIVPTP